MFIGSLRSPSMRTIIEKRLKTLSWISGLTEQERVVEFPAEFSGPAFSGRRISTSQLAILRTLTSAYDPETYEHVLRTTHLAAALASRLHLSDEERYLLCLATLLHDIGKIGIPAAILNKRGSLTEREWAVMRQHSEIGQQILLLAGGVFGCLAPIVVAHHERWDGQGYPYGLAGEEIPYAARILTVVDAFDAMTSRRPYQHPLSTSEAYRELLRCSGSQYDPYIVYAALCGAHPAI